MSLLSLPAAVVLLSFSWLETFCVLDIFAGLFIIKASIWCFFLHHVNSCIVVSAADLRNLHNRRLTAIAQTTLLLLSYKEPGNAE